MIPTALTKGSRTLWELIFSGKSLNLALYFNITNAEQTFIVVIYNSYYIFIN